MVVASVGQYCSLSPHDQLIFSILRWLREPASHSERLYFLVGVGELPSPYNHTPILKTHSISAGLIFNDMLMLRLTKLTPVFSFQLFSGSTDFFVIALVCLHILRKWKFWACL